jgi:two-component system sensor kinase FixL
MQNANEITLNSLVELNESPAPKYDFGFGLLFVFCLVDAAFIFTKIFDWLTPKEVSLISDSNQLISSCLAVLMALQVVRHPALDAATRRSWKILTLAFFSYGIGNVFWFYLSTMLGEKPFPTFADVFFWGFYPLMFWALLSFPTAKNNRSERVKFLMDVAIVMLGGITAVWHFIIQPTLAKVTDNELLSVFLNLSYTVGDLVLMLGIATILLRRVAVNNRKPLYIIVVGLISMSVADYGFAYLSLQDVYYSGHWIDTFFQTSTLAFAIASYYQYKQLAKQPPTEAENTEIQFVQPFSWLPYVAILLSCTMLLMATRQYWSEPLGLIVFSSLGVTVLVVFRQITAVKENIRLLAEQAARQSEIRFRSLVEHSSDMIAILDFKGVFTYQSPSFKTILGYENDDLIGKSSLEFVRPEDLQNIKHDFRTLIADPQAIMTREYYFKHQNGSWKILESITKSINEAENNMSCILFNLRDVTERREAENKLQAFTVKLERSNRELQNFAYVASHDLQEPLRKVQAFGDRLESKCAAEISEEGRDYINRMRNAASRMQNLINDLLTFSRVSTKIQPFKPVELRKITEDVVSDLEVRIEQTGGRVEIGELPTIDADPSQMRQLLQNLIGNALKFHRPDTPPVVKVYVEQTVQTGASFVLEGEEIQTGTGDDNICRLVIEDNGIGFDEKYLDRIFTVFQRLHGRTEYEGSGIGLAVCRKIVERHGGSITASSKLGAGAMFYIDLPITQEEINIHETIS